MNLIEALEISETHLTEKGYQASMKLGEFHAQPFGYVNGGAILAFAEITAGYATGLLGQGQYQAAGQSVTGNHLKAKKSQGMLYAQAELLHQGSRTHVWHIRMLDENNDLISQVTVTNALIYAKGK
ncbi:MAG: PaaI family thioesterase [Clostridia bacterium]|nr:PaaI family thioesterase [Clostridia bacterium]